LFIFETQKDILNEIREISVPPLTVHAITTLTLQKGHKEIIKHPFELNGFVQIF